MRVFTESDEFQLSYPSSSICSSITITRYHVLVWEATSLASLWAAVRDANLFGVVELSIVVAVEFWATDWIWFRAVDRWRRHLKVNVKVFCAPVLCFSIFTVSVLCEHSFPIRVTLVFVVTKMVLVMWMTELMCVNHDTIPAVTSHDVTLPPFTTEVYLSANLGAMLIVFLSSNVDAVLSAALGQELLFCVFMKEDIQIAFNLLCGRPINLAVLLLALKRGHTFLIPGPASIPAVRVVWTTECVIHGTLLTHAGLKFLLMTIAFHICIQELLVCIRALIPQSVPLLPGSLVLGDCFQEPCAIAIFWVRSAASLHCLTDDWGGV